MPREYPFQDSVFHRIQGAWNIEFPAEAPLLDADDRLREPGWSDSPVLAYDRKAICAPAWRVKE
jgi:hypothetical protein